MKDKKLLLTISLIVIFSTIGVFNTFMLDTEDFGSYQHYFGIGAFLLAIIECIILFKKLFPSKVDM